MVLLCACDTLHLASQDCPELKFQIFWDDPSCQLINRYHFREMCCLHFPRTHAGLIDCEEGGNTHLQIVSNLFPI
jgi:hypothetical protein